MGVTPAGSRSGSVLRAPLAVAAAIQSKPVPQAIFRGINQTNTTGASGSLVYIERVMRFRYLPLLIAVFPCLLAAELKPETTAAFDRYVKVTEDGFAKNQGFENFLWLDH